MLKHIVLAVFMTAGAASAYAQTTLKLPQQAQVGPTQDSGGDAKTLIGRSIRNAQGETVGEIKSIHLDGNGKVDEVMVSVGGLLGIAEREVKLGWKDLAVSNNGETITTSLSKEQLTALPQYLYKDPTYRGMVFGERGIWMPAHDNLGGTASLSTGDFNADGQISANAVINAAVRNSNKETIGRVVDAYLDDKGGVKVLVVSVGGVLGVGAKNVAMKWSDIRFTREGTSLVLVTDWTLESLKAMPDYKNEKRIPAAQTGG